MENTKKLQKEGEGIVALRSLCRARGQQQNVMAQKPLQMRGAHQKAFVYWSNVASFETTTGSLPVELTAMLSYPKSSNQHLLNWCLTGFEETGL